MDKKTNPPERTDSFAVSHFTGFVLLRFPGNRRDYLSGFNNVEITPGTTGKPV